MKFLSKLLSIIYGKNQRSLHGNYVDAQSKCSKSHMSSEDIGKIINVFRDVSKYTEIQYNFYRNTDLEKPLD